MNSEFDYLLELIKQIDDKNAENKTNDIEFLYRGHAKQSYKLQPSLYREKTSEKDIFSYIMTKHSNEFIGMKPLEVLAKMQHLGVATRLLDVTKNPLVGLFFAVDGIKPSGKKDKTKIYSQNDSIDNGEKESIEDTAIKESSNEKVNNKTKNAELIIFNCPNRYVKSYYSDTIKLLSCLPFLKEERQKQLLFDAVNEYLIDVYLNIIFNESLKGVFFQEDLKSIISFVKEFYYLNEKYKDKNGIEYVLNRIGKFQKVSYSDEYVVKGNVENCKNNIEDRIINNNNKSSLILFDISKIEIIIKYYTRDVDLGIEFLLEIHSLFDRIGKQSGCLFRIENQELYYNPGVIQSEKKSKKKSKKESNTSFDLYDVLKYDYKYNIESSFSTFSENDGYRSQAMEELHYKVKNYCPDFRYCAKPLDIINGVYVYPLVNTDRMRVQQGLFAIYGLSQYWNFVKYFEYQKSQGVDFPEAMKQFLKNNVKSKKKQIRDMEEKIYGIHRIPIDIKKTSGLKSALKKLGIDKETLGCSMETTYLNLIEA